MYQPQNTWTQSVPGPQNTEDAANIVLDTVFEQSDLTAFVHKQALRQMNITSDPKLIYIGGNETDYVTNMQKGYYTITEDDPRHAVYWTITSVIWMQVLSRAATKLHTLECDKPETTKSTAQQTK